MSDHRRDAAPREGDMWIVSGDLLVVVTKITGKVPHFTWRVKGIMFDLPRKVMEQPELDLFLDVIDDQLLVRL